MLKWLKLLNKAFYHAGGRMAGLLLLLLIWELLPRWNVVRDVYLSPPSQIFAAFIHHLHTGDLWVHVEVSLMRVLYGLLVAILFGTILGVLLGYFHWLEFFVDPLLQTFRQISSLSLFPVFILFFGVGELSKTIIIFWTAFWPVLLNTIHGVKNVDRLLLNSAKSMGANHWFLFRKVILPSATPEILTGIRLGGAYAMMALVAAEMVGSDSGLGFLVLTSQETFKIPDMYLGIVLLSAVGLILNYFLSFIEKKFTAWKS